MPLAPLVALLVGCGRVPERGRAPVIPPDENALYGTDQALPVGTVGEPYEALLRVEGGVGPYTFTSEATDRSNDWPVGLRLDEDGKVHGTPKQAGTFSVPVVGHDAEGRSAGMLATVTVGLVPRTVACGDTIRGTFADSAVSDFGVDLSRLDAIAWLAVELPDDALTTRVELSFSNSVDAQLYVERPAELLGSWDLLNAYANKPVEAGPDQSVTIDTGTDPSLTGYLTQPLLPVLLAGMARGDWEMTVTCSDGPIFESLAQYPTELGTEFAIDLEVYGDEAGVVITHETPEGMEPLPDWVVWDETTGTFSGTAIEAGSWEFDVVATTPDGRTRTERAIWGVYPVVDVPCGGRAPLTVTEGYFDGDFTGYYDTDGYGVFRLPLDAASTGGVYPSTVTFVVLGADEAYVGLAVPNPAWQKFYGGADRLYAGGDEVMLPLSPETYPATHHYREAEEAYFSAASTGLDLEGLEVVVVCGFDPVPDLAALPVVDALVPIEFPLSAIGGEPPYTWSAEGLPVGLELSRDGVLRGTTGEVGEHRVRLRVEDKTGASGDGTWVLTVGTDAACRGFERVLCGQSIDGEFTDVFYADDNGRGSTRTFCLVHDQGSSAIGVELYSDDSSYRVDVADPAVDLENLFDSRSSTYVVYVDVGAAEGYTLDTTTWPKLDDYEQLPIFLSLRAYDPGTWTAHFVCAP